MRTVSSFYLIALLAMLVSTKAQFGIKKEGVSAEVLANGQQTQNVEDLPPGMSYLTEQDAANIEAMIMAAAEDEQTMELVKKMKDENAPELIELSKSPIEEILGGLKQIVDDMLVLDYLFEDKEKALVEMEKAGMIPEEHLKRYQKNPELLEEDTRRGLYMQFVSLAVVGGFL